MIKVGNSFYCIKDRYAGTNNDVLVHKADRQYTILQIRESSNRITLTTERLWGSYFYCLRKDERYWLFSDYFVSLPNYRKMKLDKINYTKENEQT